MVFYLLPYNMGFPDLQPLLQSLLESGRNSDLTISCEGRKFAVHRAIVCCQSSFFDAAVKGGFKVNSIRLGQGWRPRVTLSQGGCFIANRPTWWWVLESVDLACHQHFYQSCQVCLGAGFIFLIFHYSAIESRWMIALRLGRFHGCPLDHY